MAVGAAPRVVVAGSTNMDLVATAPALPAPGETVLGHGFSMVPGGKGANQAIAATRLGAGCRLLGAIGSDSFGVTLRGRLDAAGVDTSLVRVVYGASGVALVSVDADGQNAIVVTPGANAAFTRLTPPELTAISEADVLLCQLEIPVETVTAAAAAARDAGTAVVLNAAPALPELPRALTGLVDVFVVNELEAATLTGTRDPAALLDLAPVAVLTLGSAGAWYAEAGRPAVHVPAPTVVAVDSTGAGDAFTGALAVARAEGRPLAEAVRWASAAGACCARRLGATPSLPGRAEVDELYTATYAS